MNRYIILLILLFALPVQGSSINSWAYQLQNYNVDDLVKYSADLVVIVFSNKQTDEAQG